MNSSEIKIKYPDKDFGDICLIRNFDYSENAQVIDKGWSFELPSSCDEWVIGKVEDAEEMVTNLKEAIKYAIDNP